jgi:hypothetical protein
MAALSGDVRASIDNTEIEPQRASECIRAKSFVTPIPPSV